MKLFFHKQLFALIILGLFVPFASYGGGVVSTPTLAAFNSALAGGGAVTFACDGTITVTSPESITANTTIDATGHNIIISGGTNSQIFTVSSGVNLALTELIITGGYTRTNGGAIYNQGNLAATNCAFIGNYAIGIPGTNAVNAGASGQAGSSVAGGAIYNLGTVSLSICRFQLNYAVAGAGGYGQTGATVGSGIGGNGGNGGAGGFAYGGAIFSSNSITMSDCSFINNGVQGGNGGAGGYAGYGPSGYGNAGVGGQGNDGDGGALCAYKTNIVVRTTFQGQLNLGGQSGPSGYGYLNAASGLTGGNSYGSGIYNAGTNLTINCTFYANTNESGYGGDGGAAYAGQGGNGGNGGIAEGGGIYSILVAGITNCTFSTNVVYGGGGGIAYYYPTGSAGSPGQIGAAKGGAIGNGAGTVTLKNSILAYTIYSGGTGSAGNGAGTITDAGNNISSDTSITLGGSGSHSNTNPLILPLAENGGYTSTCAEATNSTAINAGNDAAAPITDQRGYFRSGTSDIGSYEYNGTTMFVEALGSTASLDGNVGLFMIGGPGVPVTSPLTVNFVLSGTASNGVDYVSITNSAIIPAGFQYTRVLVRGIPGAFSGIDKTVTLSLLSGSNYVITPDDQYETSDTVTIFDHNTYDSTQRYVRGTSTAPDFQSFVIPVDMETGVPLDAIGGNATNLFPHNVWTNTLYHFDATNLVVQTNSMGRIAFQNPIVAFGDTVGGSPLYINQSYDFGIACGSPLILTNALRIEVYYRSNSALAGTITLTLPDVTNTNQLLNLVTNGFTQTFTGFGLQTTMLVPSTRTWGLRHGQNYLLTHTTSAAATNYFYEVEEQGFAPYNYLALTQTNSIAWSRLYAMEFSPFPTTGLSTFINQPHFDTVPMPSLYEGKSLQELESVQPTLPNLSYLTPANYLTLDDSPELRRHPILDQFVKNMGNDPLALANYVQNEIGLVDAVDYNTNDNISQTAINLGGVNRSALDTFQEGQGSPMEQCALLVYLLRQAGVPATYVFPTNGGLQMLTAQMSKLLRVQLEGAVNNLGQTNITSLINVNYPWVAAYIGTTWVQIFPWIKDTEIIEGFNLYDYMPTNYNSGYKWLTHFIANDTNIFSLSTSDQPLVLLPLFIQKSLDQNYPGMSVSDLGMQIVNRRHLYSQWSDFPTPFALSGTPTVVESLNTNLNLFNTLEVQVYSQANPTNLIDTTEMYEADLQNRMLLLKFRQVGTNNVHNMILSLEPYSTSYTNVMAFGTNANPCWKLAVTNQLNSNDDTIVYQITHRRDKFLPSTFAASASITTNVLNYTYAELGQQGFVSQQTDTFRKGDLVAFCFDSGKVTQKMLDVHAQQIWQFNQNANTNQPSTIDPDIYLGETTYLMGMSYFNYRDQFIDLASQLHKVTLMSWSEEGYGLLRPERDSSGNLVNGGNVIPITPAVHMPNNGLAIIFNASTMANSGQDYYSSTLDWWLQIGVQGSAAEHGVLESFYQTNAISTIKLLQQVGTNKLILTADNYVGLGQKTYNGVQLMNADQSIWATIVSFFATNADINSQVLMTPGAVTNGTYVGVGALLISDTEFGALVGGLNGGYADSFSADTFSSDNSPYLTLDTSPDGSVTPFQLLTTSTADDPNYLTDGAVTTWTLLEEENNLLNSQTQLDPSLIQTLASLSSLYGTQQNSASAYVQLYNTGTASTETPVYNAYAQFVSDPVNMMTGEFYADAPDITLPGPMPLQIRRNYGSQNLAENEFGFGWKISYVPFLSVNSDSSLIYAAEMDGTMVAYRQTITNADVWLPQPQDNPMLNNNSTIGIGSVGNLFNNRLQMAVVSGTNTYTLTGADGSARTFLDESFPISTFTRERPYLTKWQDSRGNYYTFQFGTDSTQPDYGQVNRIQSSNGNFVWFEYDVYGHITAAHTGDGRILSYVYDQYGDLTSVTLPDQMEIDYVYQHANDVTNGVTNVYSTHLIVEEDKPDGRVLQNIYDSQRRVTNQLSTAGVDLTPIHMATFTYTNNFNLNSPTNLLTGVTVISDYFNHATTYYYTNSLERKTVDPLNQAIVQNWYETNSVGGFQRSLKSVTDKRGLQTAYLYDSFGNLTNTIVLGDITGDGNTSQTATNSASYNANNLPVQVTDAVGNSQVLVYDPTFNFLPQQIIRYAGATPVTTNFMIYADSTNVVTLGNTTQTNVAFGVLTRRIRAYGSSDAATNDLFYNGQGFPTNSVQYTGDGDPNVVNQLFYDERGELVQRTDAAGANYVFDFDPMGRQTAQETYDAGQTVPMDFSYSYYDDNGELNWVDGPRYNPEDYIFYDHDGEGRVTTEIHWRSEANNAGTGVEAPAGYNLYAQTFSQFDPVGNLVSTIDPRGAVTTNALDALNRLVQTKHLDTNGVTVLSIEGFSYEPGGKIQSDTNALGGVTTTYYTTTGQPETRFNADGSTNAWRYYPDGRVKREIKSNGAYWQTIYDDVNRITTKVFYSAVGVSEATNSVQVDRRGNVIRKVDAGGNVFTTAFDGLDRPKVTAGPAIVTVNQVDNGGMIPNGTFSYVTNVLQQASTNFYDAAGRVVTNANALGEITVSKSDAINRPISTQVYSASGTLVHEAYMGYSADHNSVTTTNGSGANAIVNTIYTDNDGYTVLSIAYPSANASEFTFNQFDLAENLVAQQHDSLTNGVVTQWTTNDYSYDGLNRVTAQVDRDGALTTYAYDHLGDVTNRTMPGGLQWQATYSNAGQMTHEQTFASGTPTRATSYTYYSSGTSSAGLLDNKTDGRGVSCTYTYDDWLRQAAMTYSGSLPEQNLTTTWHYEPRGFVTNITEQFGSTNTGPNTSIVRSYDPYGQLSSESVSGGSFGYGASQTFDGAGRRTMLGIGGVDYSFAWQADNALIYASDPTGSGSYSYNTAGLLTDRLVGNRYTTIISRDGEGRPLSIDTTVNMLSELNETIAWTGDGLLAAHTLERGDFTDSRSYAYASMSRRLTQEQLNLNTSTTYTNSFTYDEGVAGGLGVLTQMGQANGSADLWKGGVDAFSRVATETNNTFQYPAYGHVNGQSTLLSAWLDNQPISISTVGTNAMQWRAMMELAPGVHQLKVSAAHPSGFYTAWATNSFTNNIAYQATVDSYDAAGEITNRVWRSPNGTIDRTQALSWDARGRLHSVTERDANNSGYNWSAVYDPFNRRLQTTTVLVTNGVASTAPPQTINSYFDPQVEFLELGVSYSSQTIWKLYGPDLNGRYGGLNGTGGFDAVSPYLNLFNPVISDFRGNILGEVTNGAVSWNPSRPTGYGSVPGYRPAAFADGADMAQSSAWRGREVDIAGYYNIGLRPYDPISGRWLTYDSVWNSQDPNYYTFAGGEPIMGFDPDGRCIETGIDYGVTFINNGVHGIGQAGAIGSDMIGSTTAGIYDSIFGTDVEGNYQGYSALYQNISANPSSGPTGGQILGGTLNAEANLGTLGLYGMAQGGYTAATTGNYSQLGNSSINALLLSGGVNEMQSEGINPYSVGYTPSTSTADGTVSITTPYAVEAQSSSTAAQTALAQAQNGATLYRMGQTGVSMTGESQYWSLQNPLLDPNYANSMGMPGVTSDFIMTGTLNPGASVIANEAPGLGANTGNGIQIVTEPGGVGGLTFHMP
ncbi:MAG TPA: choice-of-anchor Q domain-containing protein [Verrucomicrobiae bacterium]|nr:choice-of-anchor Q domain-containing protein [Verrucomicrobiae bacterium]